MEKERRVDTSTISFISFLQRRHLWGIQARAEGTGQEQTDDEWVDLGTKAALLQL